MLLIKVKQVLYINNLFILLQPVLMSKTSKDIAQALTNQVFKTLKKDLSKGKVSLPEQGTQPNELPLLTTSKISKIDEKQQNKLHTIMRKRKMLEEELQRIRYDEQVAKQKIPHPMQQTEQGKTRYFRSTITPEQKDKIKKVLSDTKKFEQLAQKKTIQLQQMIKKEEEQKRRLKELEDKEMHERKKRQIQEKLKQIQIRKQQRTKQIKEKNKEFQKVARLKFLHEAIQQKWRIVQKSEEEQNQKILSKKRQQKKFNITEIKQHARRYSDIVNTNRQKREKDSQELRASLIQQSRLARHSYSTFFKTINEEENNQKQTMREKINTNRMLQTKKVMYGQTVKQKNKSLFKNQSAIPKIQSKTTDIRTSRSLDNLALNKLGNDYMKQIHSCIDTTPILQQNSLQPKNQQTFKYSDYLTKARQTRKPKNPEQEEPIQLRQLKTIIKKKNQDKETKLFKAKKLVQRMDEKANINSTKNMVNSILAKLSLIEEFAQQ